MDDPNVPAQDVVGVMKEYVHAGKVKYLGLSNTTPDNVRIAIMAELANASGPHRLSG